MGVSDSPPKEPAEEPLLLKDPWLAALLAWLIPGLGHWYQGRRHKALIFSICILSTFFYGLYLGEGRVVYASWRPGDQRLPYLCQVVTGIPALPAIVQARRFPTNESRRDPLRRMLDGQSRWSDWFMTPPFVYGPNEPRGADNPDELDALHRRLPRFFELGTVYTMIAGLLNLLAIFDAWGGPAYGIRWRRGPPASTDSKHPA